ncbi:ABC transporter permease [Streptomyces beijiangensis]|uniref:Transport permease protein n=1 Tax=Streptomyces beijiangensis TaxID=163361 RepID=A0A939FD07_9ACTN|nr:ABC transporter permease [Streptomyces beijiangensis]MBO0515859.1 ABC transporter permease [Streptomyces beijiangensis]
MSTVPTARLGALARAELTLMGRNKATLFTALALPTMLTVSMYSVVKDMDLADTGLTVGSVLLPGALGYVLLFAVYSTLVGVFVVRREGLVLKRLRTGELRDQEILAGASFPTVAMGVVQCVLIAVGGSLAMGVAAPRAWWLVFVGLVIGMVLMCALAAATAAVTRSAEGAQITIAPVLLLSMAGSGLVVPLDVLPDRLAAFCELLPLTPVVGMIRSGWTGGVDGYETLGQVATAVAWTVIAVFAVRKWFRWEPRR